MHRLSALVAAVLLAAPSAAAAEPDEAAPPAPPAETVPAAPPPPETVPAAPPPDQQPPPGTAALGITGMHRVGERRVALTGQALEVRGSVSRFVEGETVHVTVRRGRRTLRSVTKPVAAGENGKGRFAANVRVRDAGAISVSATSQAGWKAAPLEVAVIRPSARSPLGVRLLQGGLARLGYAVPRSGRYDAATGRAVLAYRKVNRMRRTTGASAAIVLRVADGRGAFGVRYPAHGKHVEADLSRQVIALVQDGKPYRVFHTSSGKPSTPTVLGSFRFYLKQPGTNAKGMVHSNYFIRGYAIHGYKEVPTRPASHGCLRVPIPNARFIYDWIALGDRIDVYR